MSTKLSKHLPLFLAGLALTLMALPSVVRADWDAGVRAGYYADTEEPFLGAELLGDVGPRGLYFNPNFEWVLIDDRDLWTLNGDFHYDFSTQGEWSVWAGGGPAIVFRENRRGDEDNDFGANLLAGVGMNRGAVRPYVQGKILLADETEAVIGVGLRFF